MQTQLREPRKSLTFVCSAAVCGVGDTWTVKRLLSQLAPKPLSMCLCEWKTITSLKKLNRNPLLGWLPTFFCFLFTTNIVYSNWHKVQFTFIQYITLNRMYITYLSSFVPPHILHANLFWVNKLRKSHFYSMTFFLSFFCRHSNANREEKLIAFLLWEDSFLLLTWLYGGGGE